MKREAIPKHLPHTPGVYFFLGKRRQVLYIGKATSLHSRVRSYFDSHIHEKRSPLIEKMVLEAKTITFTKTDSVLEAILLETNLIRTHKPEYNIRAKDDKSFNHLVITNESFPRILVVRGKDLTKAAEKSYRKIYGPFPNGTLFKSALTIIRKLFQYYDVPYTLESAKKSKIRKGVIDFNTQIGLYPADVTSSEYMQTIRHIEMFFEGKKKEIIRELKKEMNAFAKHEAFEQAQKLKEKIFALEHIHDVALLRDETREYRDERMLRIEAYDVAHFGGKAMVGVCVVIEGGERKLDGYRKFFIHQEKSDDTRALKEMLMRRLAHAEWPLPDVIVVDGGTPQKNVTLKVLQKFQKSIPVISVVKDEHHKPKVIQGPQNLIQSERNSILHANAEAHRFAITFHKKIRKNSFQSTLKK